MNLSCISLYSYSVNPNICQPSFKRLAMLFLQIQLTFMYIHR